MGRLARYVAAVALAIPVGATGWFELVYLFFGLRGEDPPLSYNVLAAVAAFGIALAWPLRGTARAAEVVRSMPIVALRSRWGLALVFWLCDWLAAKRLRRPGAG